MANLSIKTGTISRSMLVGNAPYIPPAYESISSTTLSATTGWVTLGSIPQTYASLQVRILGRSQQGTLRASTVSMLINSDQTTSYASHLLQGNGTSATNSGAASNNRMDIGYVPTSGYTSGFFGSLIIDIHNYTSTTQNKTVRAYSGFDGNGSGTVALGSGVFQKTNAVTDIAFSNENNGFDWSVGTTFALYGIKGA